MVPPAPARHDEFLKDTAIKILAGSTVATSTAARLARRGINTELLVKLFQERGRETQVGPFRFKLIDADPETPDDFGVLVRRV